MAKSQGLPEIFNTDQGSQFTSPEWTGRLEGLGIRVSMDGKGRWMDNVFIERLWRSLKYEDIYLKGYANIGDLEVGVEEGTIFAPPKSVSLAALAGSRIDGNIIAAHRRSVAFVASLFCPHACDPEAREGGANQGTNPPLLASVFTSG